MSDQAYHDAQMFEVQDPIPKLPTQRNHSGLNILNESNFTQNNAWHKCNLLSLDGGGIRGYWSLLVLRKLFECIATEEQRLDRATMEHHSFAPKRWPENVSHLITHEQRRGVDGAVIDDAIRYLPCHYFDLMCGSSTGALIAIMLGRFRMPVPDCIHEYRRLGEEVFGKPRLVHALRFKIGDRTKYSTARLEKVFQDVAERRCEEMEDHQRIDFPMPPGLCKVVVTTLKDTEKFDGGKPYLLRTYDHEQPSTPIPTAEQPRPPGSHPNHSNTNRSATLQVGGQGHRRVNYGKANQFEVTEVARAATAAKFYFEPFERKTRQSGKYVRFTDGGFSLSNNPTKEGIREIRSLNAHNKVNIVVSVGTARSTRSDIKKSKIFSLLDTAYHLAHKSTDPEAIHNDMTDESNEGDGFRYYRLNDSDGLDIPLDEWKPKRSFLISEKEAGCETIDKIENAFNKWLANKFEDLQNCAKELVECRRERMDTPQWERYATGCTYTCRAPSCATQSFLHLDAFRSHLRDCHREMTHPEDRATEWRKQWEYQAGHRQ